MFNAPTITKPSHGDLVKEQNRELAEFIGHLPKATISKALQGKLNVLHAAFPAPGATVENKYATLALYAQFSTEFPEEVALYAADWLLSNNPRNTATFTQPPTAQDFREACAKINATWRGRVYNYFISGQETRDHSKTEIYALPKIVGYTPIWGYNPSSIRSEAIVWGPEPMQPGCLIPDRLVVEYLKAYFTSEAHVEDLADWPACKVALLPKGVLTADQAAKVATITKARQDAAEADRKAREYEAALGPELAKARRTVRLRYARQEIPSEDVVLAEARELLEHQRLNPPTKPERSWARWKEPSNG